MALITIPYPLGLDYYVQDQQTRLYNRLCEVWGIDGSLYNAFGRVYRNHTTDGYIPQFYNPATQNYVDSAGNNTTGGIFFDDRLAAVSYYHVLDPIKGDKGVWTVKAELLFFVDLSKITPSGISAASQQGQRMDEICVNDVRDYIQAAGSNWTLHADYRDVDKVMEHFSGAVKKNNLTKDMHPRFCFRLDMELRYNPLLNRNKTAIPNIMPQLIPQSLVLFIKNSPDPTQLIQVGQSAFIRAQYAPSNTLIPIVNGASNGWLAGRKVNYPFYYNSTPEMTPTYNATTGTWDRTAQGGFVDGDIVIIQVLNNQFN